MRRQGWRERACVWPFFKTFFFLHTQPLFANTTSLANKTAAILAAANAKERAIVASLGGPKANASVLAETMLAYKNLTSGNFVSVVVPGSVTTAPSGTLQCLVNADGLVAGLVGENSK
jgi:hypothetical protein